MFNDYFPFLAGAFLAGAFLAGAFLAGAFLLDIAKIFTSFAIYINNYIIIIELKSNKNVNNLKKMCIIWLK